MKQKFFLYVEEGVGIFEDLDKASEVKQDLNDVGIKARLRMKTPNFDKGKKGIKKSDEDYYFDKAFDEKMNQ
tara:strand:+ start:456 stop:671 length:216 start_codon:yes stop_codon:yes gene_type:complete